jgi:two-component system, OmpR family, response regulator VicR
MPSENTYVLIIDDNPSDADVMRGLLDRIGVRYDVVFDYRDLQAALAEISTPSVIFLDLEIPGTNGYEVLEFIRSVPKFSKVPIVAYSAHSSEMNFARNAGFNSFLGKPLRSSQFPAQLDQILNGESVWEVR